MKINGYNIAPGADLRGAGLREADLYKADLRGADLREADLRGAYMFRADLRGADLRGADLRGANLHRADLRRADLREADLFGADLYEACLISQAGTPNENVDGFELIDGGAWAVGYRTKTSPYQGASDYHVSELREAPLTVYDDQECNHGLYIMPSIEAVRKFRGSNTDKIVKVLFRPWDAHRAGDKWRVSWFIVWDEE